MKRIFICSPYSGDIPRNVEIAKHKKWLSK